MNTTHSQMNKCPNSAPYLCTDLMVLILECHIRNNYQYRIFTTWQAIPFKRKFYQLLCQNLAYCLVRASAADHVAATVEVG